MGTEFPWRWGRGTISANLDVIWGMSVKTISQMSDDPLVRPASRGALIKPALPESAASNRQLHHTQGHDHTPRQTAA